MAYFSWTDDLSVGNRFIDKDHQTLIALINQLHDAMKQGQGDAIVDAILFDLLVYTKGHFQREEAEMRRIGYAGLDAHAREHQRLLQSVNELREAEGADRSILCIKAADFLQEWLRKHILGSDMALSKVIAAADVH